MEQMLKLCMFLRRAKLTFMQLLSTEILIVYRLCVDFFWALHLCTKCTVMAKKMLKHTKCAQWVSVQTTDWIHQLFTSRGTEKLMRGSTLAMHQGCPLPLCHISSENLTWHVYIGFLHLPFKPLWASWRWGELRLLSPVSLRSFSLCTPSQMSTFG